MPITIVKMEMSIYDQIYMTYIFKSYFLKSRSKQLKKSNFLNMRIDMFKIYNHSIMFNQKVYICLK